MVAEGGTGVEDAPASRCGTGSPAGSLPPHFAQNFARWGFEWPHEGHAIGSTAPHSMQKMLPAGLSVLQLGHYMLHLTPDDA